MHKSPHYKWWVVGMLWFCGFLNYADRQAIYSVFPLLEKEMGLTPVQLGLLGSAFAWVYGLGAPLAGYVADRVRRKTAILAGLHAWSAICMATAFSRALPQLLFFRAALGLSETFYFPAAMSMVGGYHGQDTRSRAMGLHQTSVYAGTIAGGFLAGLVGQYYGWRHSLIAFGAAGVLLGLVLQRTLAEPERAGEGPGMPVADFFRMLAATPTAVLLMAAFLLSNFVAAVMLSWMPKFLYDKFHLSLAMSGLTATIFMQLASMAGAPLGGWLADVLRRRTPGGRMIVQLAGLVCGAPFVVLCGQTGSVAWLIVALTMWGFSKGLYDANIWASLFDVIRPEARGITVGFMNSLGWLLGGGTAPVVIGFLAQRYGLSLAISSAGAAYLAAAVILLAGILFTVRRDAAKMG